MDQKVLFIADHLRGGHTFSDLCRLYGISRKTGYKWVGRYREQDLEGLQERIRKPHRSPHRTPYAVRKTIVELRTGRRDPPGPKKIRALLEQRHPDWDIPCHTTIYTILKEQGLVKPGKNRRRVAAGQQPFAAVREPNDLWSADFKGQFKTGDGCWCYPLTVMDHQSRYLLSCRIFDATSFEQTRAAFEELFRRYGLPWRIRTDNGAPFASPSPGGLSRLSRWWIRLGIVPERIEPGKPQQNGRHERMHRTLKAAAAAPAAQSVALQQQEFDRFRHQYNHERPHESLGQKPPASAYRPSARPMPDKLPELSYPGHFLVAYVNHNGVIYQQGHRVYVSGLLKGETVGLEQIAEDVWDVYYGPLRLGSFDKRQTTKDRNDYLRLNV